MKKILVITFILLISLPSLAWLTASDYELDENRIRIKPPIYSFQRLTSKQFYEEFNDYFNDNFSSRGYFVLAKNYIDFFIFKTDPSNKIHMGDDGWLYYRKYITYQFNKNSCGDKAYMDQLFLYLHGLEHVLNSSGRKLFLIVPPTKPRIYPEHVGSVPEESRCGKTLYDLFLDHQDIRPIKGFISLDESLFKEKTKDRIYFKTDSHWNHNGARASSKAVLQKIFNKKDITYNKIEYYNGMFSGDIAKMMGGLPIYENILLMKDMTEDERYLNTRQPEFYLSATPDDAPEDAPTAVLYRDSFGGWLVPYLKDSFKTIDVFFSSEVPSRYTGLGSEEERFDLFDIVMIEVMEYGLYNVRIDLGRIIDSLGAEFKAPKTAGISLSNISPIKHIRIADRGDFLSIESIGKQSFFGIQSIPASDDRIFRLLKLSIDSPRVSYLNVSYSNKDNPLLDTANQQLILYKGRHDVYIPLPFWKELTIYLNPGTKPGVYNLYSAEIIEFPR